MTLATARKRIQKSFAFELLVVMLVTAAVGFGYLYPTYNLLYQGVVDRYLGDGGGDPQTLAFQNNVILQTLKHHPSWLLYGSVFTPQFQAPNGAPMWITWVERVLVPLASLFSKEAAPQTFLVGIFIAQINAICAYGFGRSFGWNRYLSLGAALVWTYNPFVRARLDAHAGLAATYYLPLLFWSLNTIQKRLRASEHPSWRELTVPALGMVLTFFAAHYFIVATLFLSAVVLLIFLRTRSRNVALGPAFLTLVLAGIPAVLFLAWNFLVPVPRGVMEHSAQAYPDNTLTRIVYDLAAKPEDYLAGDIRFGVEDWFPPKQAFNNLMREKGRVTVGAETINGIRWSILLFAFVGGVLAFSRLGLRVLRLAERARLRAAFWFTLVAFLLSVAPNFLMIYGVEVNLSRFSFNIMPNFRCPNRLGPSVYFGCLMMAGTVLQALLRNGERLRLPAWRHVLFFFLVTFAVAEYIPYHALMAAPLRPARPALQDENGWCGTGLYAPPVGAWEENTRSQEIFGTSCRIMPWPNYLQLTKDDIVRFARCSGMNFLIYPYSPGLLQGICDELNFELVSPDSCRSRTPVQPVRNAHHICQPPSL